MYPHFSRIHIWNLFTKYIWNYPREHLKWFRLHLASVTEKPERPSWAVKHGAEMPALALTRGNATPQHRHRQRKHPHCRANSSSTLSTVLCHANAWPRITPADKEDSYFGPFYQDQYGSDRKSNFISLVLMQLDNFGILDHLCTTVHTHDNLNHCSLGGCAIHIPLLSCS